MSKTLKRAESFLFFLTILFLPTQLGRHFWPNFSYIYSLKIDYLSPTVYFWDILVVLLFGIYIIQRKKINKLALNLVLFFIFTQIFSLFNTSNLGAGLVRVEQYLINALFGLYIASQNWGIIKNKIFMPLSISLVCEGAIAILQVLTSKSLGLWILGERTFFITTPAIAKFDFGGLEFLRPYATFPHPNVLAAFLVLGLLILYLINKDDFSKKRFRVIFLSLFVSIATFLTYSRTVLLVGILSAFFILKKKALLAVFVLLVLLSPLLYTRFSSAFNFDNLTLLRRAELAKTSIELFLQSPLFGVGLNNFIPSLSANLISGPNRFLQPVHNIFLLSLSETGIIGLVGFFIFIGFPIFKFFKLRTTNYELRTTLLIWGTLLFLGLFDHYFLTLPQGQRLLFLVWGLSLSVLK